MLGGYVAVVMFNRWGVSFFYCLPVGFHSTGPGGRRYWSAPFIPVFTTQCPGPGALYDGHRLCVHGHGLLFHGVPSTRSSSFPLSYRVSAHLVHRPRCRCLPSLPLGFCGVIALFLHFALMRTRFGSRLRAAVDNGRIARGLGINVNRLFVITFGIGSGLAGLAGALGIEIFDLDPVFPVKFLIYFLIVVAVGGTGTVGGPWRPRSSSAFLTSPVSITCLRSAPLSFTPSWSACSYGVPRGSSAGA